MKRRIVSCTAVFLAFLCMACGQQEMQKVEESEQDVVPESKQEVTEGFQSDRDTLVTNQEEINGLNCIVQVQTDNQRGSGVLWDMQDNYWTFVTAAHVVEGLEQAEIYFVAEDKICSGQVYCVEGLDLAFIQVETELLEENITANYVECIVVEAEVKSDDTISAIGYNASAEKLYYDGNVWEPWIYTEDFDNYMLLCECEAEAGMSGGGVFTQEKALTGIICGQNEEGLVAILPAGVIAGEYALFIDY